MEDEPTTTKKALAKKLGISRSSLYDKPKKPPSDHVKRIYASLKMSPQQCYALKTASFVPMTV